MQIKKLGTLIDKILTLESDAEAIEAPAKALRKRAAKYREQLLKDFSKDEIKAAKGKLGAASLVHSESLEVSDYNKLKAYIKKNDALDLLQLRVNKTAWDERMEDRNKRPIPGININQRITLRVSKAKG